MTSCDLFPQGYCMKSPPCQPQVRNSAWGGPSSNKGNFCLSCSKCFNPWPPPPISQIYPRFIYLYNPRFCHDLGWTFHLWAVSKGLLIEKTGKRFFIWRLTPICWQQILFMWLGLLYSWLPISVLAKDGAMTLVDPNAIFYLQRTPSYLLLDYNGKFNGFSAQKNNILN
jgi:hypothetical protein